MNFDQTPYDIKKTVKQGFIYLLIAFPFVLISSILLTIVKAPLFVVMFSNVVVGGGVIFVVWIIHNKIKEKRQNSKNDNTKKFDPFKD